MVVTTFHWTLKQHSKSRRPFPCLFSLQFHTTLENWSSTAPTCEAEHVSASFVWLLVPNRLFQRQPELPCQANTPSEQLMPKSQSNAPQTRSLWSVSLYTSYSDSKIT